MKIEIILGNAGYGKWPFVVFVLYFFLWCYCCYGGDSQSLEMALFICTNVLDGVGVMNQDDGGGGKP